jgi:hypothetical protein
MSQKWENINQKFVCLNVASVNISYITHGELRLLSRSVIFICKFL